MATRYWVGGNGTWSASNTTNWSTTPGGSGGASVPGSGDTARFDASSGSATVTVASDQPLVGGFNNTGFTGSFISYSPKLSGTITLGANMGFTVPGGSTATVTTNGNTISCTASGTVTFTDAVTATILYFSDYSVITFKSSTTNTAIAISWPGSRTTSEIKSSIPGTRTTLSMSSGIEVVEHIKATDIAFSGSGTWYYGAGYVDGGNNTGISAEPPSTTGVNSLFWVVA